MKTLRVLCFIQKSRFFSFPPVDQVSASPLEAGLAPADSLEGELNSLTTQPCPFQGDQRFLVLRVSGLFLEPPKLAAAAGTRPSSRSPLPSSTPPQASAPWPP